MTEFDNTCFHCGEPLPAVPLRVKLDDREQLACCNGCAAAAAFIRDAGLQDYYRIRSAHGARASEGDFSCWDRDDVLAEHARRIGDVSEITLISDGMHCAACAWLIDRALRLEPGVESVQANAVTGRIHLRWLPQRTPLSQLVRRLAGLGYPVNLAPDAAREQQRLRARRLLMLRLGVAALGSMQAMMLAEALYLDFDNSMPVVTRDFFRWITLLISTPVVFFSGWPFIDGLRREWRARRPGMDTLVGGSILLAWAASLIETVRGGPHVWFDAAVMFVFFLLAARALEGFARHRANAVVERLARARPALVQRVDGTGRLETVPLAALRPGDRVEVAAGAVVPADGRLLSAAEFDESLLSGESKAQARGVGDSVLAGSVCLSRPTRIDVLRVGAETRLSRLVALVEQAQAAKPQLAQWADRLAGRLVWALLAAATLTYVLWLPESPARAFEVALSVLVVSCPCALSLAIPTTLVAAHAALARSGLLALNPNALARLAAVDHVVFDKTGTLSRGTPQLERSDMFRDLPLSRAIAIAAALEQAANHPLAAAFRHPEQALLSSEDIEVVPGRGVSGRIERQRYRLGRADFAVDRQDDGAIWLGDQQGGALARFEVGDAPRAEAAAALNELRALGATTSIASGDSPAAVAELAKRVVVDDHHARLLPEDKLAWLRSWQQGGRRVLAVGDGINDAPLLAAADVSIAMGSGASLSHRAADFVLEHGDLRAIPQALRIARKAQRITRQNLAWALGYNALALPFAMLGWIPPWLAALGMTASSLLVTVNALRLQSTAAGRASAESRPNLATQPAAQTAG